MWCTVYSHKREDGRGGDVHLLTSLRLGSVTSKHKGRGPYRGLLNPCRLEKSLLRTNRGRNELKDSMDVRITESTR